MLITLQAEGLTGYGECVATRDPGYNYETTGTAWHILKDFVAPLLLGQDVIDAGDFQKSESKGSAATISPKPAWRWLYGTCSASAMASRSGKCSAGCVTGWMWGFRSGSSFAPGFGQTVASYLDQGYRRVKIKIKPGPGSGETSAVRKAYPDLRLQVDANSAYTLETADVLKAIDDLDLLLIEQPLFEDDIWDHRKLQAEFKTPICLDESVITPRHARYALEMEACRIINIKPARVAASARGLRSIIIVMSAVSRLVRWDAGDRRGARFQPRHRLPARFYSTRRHLCLRPLLPAGHYQ